MDRHCQQLPCRDEDEGGEEKVSTFHGGYWSVVRRTGCDRTAVEKCRGDSRRPHAMQAG